MEDLSQLDHRFLLHITLTQRIRYRGSSSQTWSKGTKVSSQIESDKTCSTSYSLTLRRLALGETASDLIRLVLAL